MAVDSELHVNVTFYDVLHETKQKNINKLSRVRSTDWKSSLTVNVAINRSSKVCSTHIFKKVFNTSKIRNRDIPC